MRLIPVVPHPSLAGCNYFKDFVSPPGPAFPNAPPTPPSISRQLLDESHSVQLKTLMYGCSPELHVIGVGFGIVEEYHTIVIGGSRI